MKKNLFFTLITTAILTACTQEQGNAALSTTTPTASSDPLPQQTTRFTALQLNAYMNPTLS